jgi:hypothetical protein
MKSAELLFGPPPRLMLNDGGTSVRTLFLFPYTEEEYGSLGLIEQTQYRT